MGAIIHFGCSILSKVFQIFSLGGDPREGGLELDARNSEELIASCQMKSDNIDVVGIPYVINIITLVGE